MISGGTPDNGITAQMVYYDPSNPHASIAGKIGSWNAGKRSFKHRGRDWTPTQSSALPDRQPPY
jgi:hypothetical protein